MKQQRALKNLNRPLVNYIKLTRTHVFLNRQCAVTALRYSTVQRSEIQGGNVWCQPNGELEGNSTLCDMPRNNHVTWLMAVPHDTPYY
ncbi:hypothetical protein J6590_018389 [Homalodisca vitripennis]|nr:hypothetical protein J6590_018389 [Homalodisca vitripennis]